MAVKKISELAGRGVTDTIQPDPEHFALKLTDGTTTAPVALPPGRKGDPGRDGSNVLPTGVAVAEAIEPGGEARPALNAVIAGAAGGLTAPFEKLLEPRTIGFGDSLTEAGSNPNSSGQGEKSYFAQTTVMSDQQVRYYRNAGVAGDTVEQMWARIESDVINHRPDRVILKGGTNNMGQADQTSAREHVVMILDRLQEAGILTVVVSIPPADGLSQSGRDRIIAHNDFLRTEARLRGMLFVDTFALHVDTTTGGFKSAHTTDGVHLTILGAQLEGQAVAAALAGRYPVGRVYTALSNADADNLLSGAAFESDTAGVPTGWVANTSAGTVSVVEDAEVVGRAVELTRTSATGTLSLTQNITSGISPGDRFSLAVRFKPAQEGVEYSIYAQAVDDDYTQLSVYRPVRAWVGGYDRYVTAFIEGEYPVGATRLQVYLHTSAGLGSIRFAAPKVRNLTSGTGSGDGGGSGPPEPTLPTWPTFPPVDLVTSNSDPKSLLVNPLLQDNNTDGTPDGWVISDAPSRATVSVGTDPGIDGNFVRIERAEGDGTFAVSQAASSGFVEGDTLEAAVRFRSPSSAVTANFYVISSDSAYNVLSNTQILITWAGETDGWETAAATLVVPAGATRVVFYMQTAVGIGHVDWAQATLRKPV